MGRRLVLDNCHGQTIHKLFSREFFGKSVDWDAANGEQCDEHDERFW